MSRIVGPQRGCQRRGALRTPPARSDEKPHSCVLRPCVACRRAARRHLLPLRQNKLSCCSPLDARRRGLAAPRAHAVAGHAFWVIQGCRDRVHPQSPLTLKRERRQYVHGAATSEQVIRSLQLLLRVPRPPIQRPRACAYTRTNLEMARGRGVLSCQYCSLEKKTNHFEGKRKRLRVLLL